MTLREHMEVLHNKQREVFSCEQCSFKSNWARALKKHMKIHNGGSYSCNSCNFITNEKDQLVEHQSSVHGIVLEEHQCSQCYFVTDQEYKLMEHMHKRHSNDGKVLMYSCPDCDYKTKWKRLIKGHRRIHTGELFRCSKCDFATITKTRLNEHETTHLEMSERGYACPHCPYKATRQTRLNEHIVNRHYPDRKQLHKCDKCEFSTLWKSYMKVHQKIHTGEVFKCSRCTYATPVRSQLQRHERSLHKVGNGFKISTANNLYKCGHCPYTAARKARLSEHIHQRHNDANLEVLHCPACSFITTWQKSLEDHMSVHDKDWLRCDACEYRTVSTEDFREHMQTNHLVGGYRCTLCEFVGKEIEDYNSHLISDHEGADRSGDMEINYISTSVKREYDVKKCDFCDFSAHPKELLDAHMITHSNEIIREKLKAKENLVFKPVKNGALIPPAFQQILY